MKQIIPGYIWSGDTARWAALLKTIDSGDFVVFNLDNGPVNRGLSQAEAANIKNVRLRGGKPLGYVALNFGNRNLDDILLDMEEWAKAGIVEFLFDQTPMPMNHWIRVLPLYARQLSGDIAQVWFNPGVPLKAGEGVSSGVAKWPSVGVHWLTHEAAYGSLIPSVDQPRRGAIVHSAVDPKRHKEILSQLRALGYAYGWVTADPGPHGNHYDGDPTT